MKRDVSPILKDPTYGQPKKPRRLPARSVKRISETEARDRVRTEVLGRDNYRCVGPDAGLPGRCSSPFPDRPVLEVHETAQRSTHPGSHLRPDDCVTLCQSHHDAISSPVGDMRVLAEASGLIKRATS